jgi:hypothetical protein
MPLLLLRMITVGLVLSLGASCVPHTVPFNSFKITQDQFYKGIKTIVLTPLQIPEGIGDQVSLNAHLESCVEAELKKAKFDVVPSRVYKDIWDGRIKEVGGYFNPRTGEVDKQKYESIVEYTRKELRSRCNADALLYQAICIVQVEFFGNVARWHGTSEMIEEPGKKSETQGSTRALSFCVWIEDIHGVEGYVNFGGIQLLSKLKATGSLFKNKEFVNVPEDEILNNQERNEAAVKIALSPLIVNKTLLERQNK